MDYYNSITKSFAVSQSVLLDGFDYSQPIVEDLGTQRAGTTICQVHTLENLGPKIAVIDWDYTITGPGMVGLGKDQGIEVLMLESVNAQYSTAGKLVEAIITKTWECSVTTWVVDISSVSGNGIYGVGLVISLDGTTPAFQVFHTGGTDMSPDNTWLYQEYPWDSPLVPVSAVEGIEAIGDKNGQHFEIAIDCEYMCGAGNEYYWLMQLRTLQISYVNDIDSWDWTDCTDFITNWTGTELVFPLTLMPGESREFNLALNLDPMLVPGNYVATTTLMPAP